MHTKSTQILKGTGSYIASNILNSAAAFAVSVIVSIYMGKEGLGTFSVSFVIVLIGVLLSELGLNPIILREYSRSVAPPRLTLYSVLALRSTASLIVSACVLLGASVIKSPIVNSSLLSGIALLIVSRSVGSGLENVIKARLRHLVYLTLTAGNAVLQISAAFATLRLGFGIGAVVLALAAVDFIKVAALLYLEKGELSAQTEGGRLTLHRVRSVLTQGAPFILIGLLSFINERADILLIAWLRDAATAGVYSAASRFMIIGNILDSSILASALPALSLLRNDAERGYLTGQVFAATLVVAAAIGFVLFIGAPTILKLTFHFSESVTVLQVFAVGFPAMLANRIARTFFYSLQKEHIAATILAVGCLGSILINLAIIPRFGAVGAAGVAVTTEYAVAAAYGIVYLRSSLRNALSIGVTP